MSELMQVSSSIACSVLWEEGALVDGQLLVIVDEGGRRGAAGLFNEGDVGLGE